MQFCIAVWQTKYTILSKWQAFNEKQLLNCHGEKKGKRNSAIIIPIYNLFNLTLNKNSWTS